MVTISNHIRGYKFNDTKHNEQNEQIESDNTSQIEIESYQDEDIILRMR